ncbi:MAG: transporter [Bacteroidales bacterium]|nr:transporter [Bacteroidales bacterium]
MSRVNSRLQNFLPHFAYLCSVISKKQAMLRILKAYMLPIAMTLGILFSNFFSQFAGIIPYLLFSMLFVTYCKMPFDQIRFTRFHVYLVAIQLFGSLLVYGLLYLYNPVVAQGTMICVLAPTATAAVVITGLLGGNLASLTAFTLLSNIVVAVFSPIIFSFIGNHNELSFFQTLISILSEVFPMLALPILLAYIVKKVTPKVHAKIESIHNLSFYLWAVALVIVLAKTILFLKAHLHTDLKIELIIAGLALVVCITQFLLGRKVGSKFDNTIAGGQGLGQKNTVLAIWMAQSYLDPISSIGPGAYIVWQNSVNSFQLWLKNRR